MALRPTQFEVYAVNQADNLPDDSSPKSIVCHQSEAKF